jgi:hypothetical protein
MTLTRPPADDKSSGVNETDLTDTPGVADAPALVDETKPRPTELKPATAASNQRDHLGLLGHGDDFIFGVPR